MVFTAGQVVYQSRARKVKPCVGKIIMTIPEWMTTITNGLIAVFGITDAEATTGLHIVGNN